MKKILLAFTFLGCNDDVKQSKDSVIKETEKLGYRVLSLYSVSSTHFIKIVDYVSGLDDNQRMKISDTGEGYWFCIAEKENNIHVLIFEDKGELPLIASEKISENCCR
jgi:hypothetical protein